MLTTCWESGITCSGCEAEISVGEEMLYGQHLACASDAARKKREIAGTMGTLDTALLQVAARGRIMLTRAQLRELIAMACEADPSFAPVRRPDKALGPMQWYGRIAGWSPARVAAGLSGSEVAGLWLDYLDVGRTPPIRHRDLSAIIDRITGV